MDIEIRRNLDIQFNVTCLNPETLKDLFEMTDDQKREQERFETWRRQVEDEFWRFVNGKEVYDAPWLIDMKPESSPVEGLKQICEK